MRPINKGNAPRVYSDYKQARHDLAKEIGYYCSYCEMATKNMIEVEHIHPIKNGGNPLDWNNFVLSCKYCNTVKSNANLDRKGYIWPDRDNTDLVFEYDEINIISPNPNLQRNIQNASKKTIDLLGLNRAPGLPNEPTEADTRWISRIEAWDIAKRSIENWKFAPSNAMAEQIAIAAKTGHFSIWCTVFKNEPQVLNEIRKEYKGTFFEFNANGNRVIRNGGII